MTAQQRVLRPRHVFAERNVPERHVVERAPSIHRRDVVPAAERRLIGGSERRKRVGIGKLHAAQPRLLVRTKPVGRVLVEIVRHDLLPADGRHRGIVEVTVHPRQPAFVDRPSILNRERDELSSGERNGQVSRAAVVEFARLNLVEAHGVLRNDIDRPVARAGVDDNDFHPAGQRLAEQSVEARANRCRCVSDRDDDGKQRAIRRHSYFIPSAEYFRIFS